MLTGQVRIATSLEKPVKYSQKLSLIGKCFEAMLIVSRICSFSARALIECPLLLQSKLDKNQKNIPLYRIS